MRRLSTVFLVCFVALLMGLGGMVAWKVRARPAPAPPAPTEQADYRITEIHINETLEGNLRWMLDADHAEIFDKQQRTVMRQVAIRLFSKDAEWTVTAAEGVLDNEKRDVSLTGDVVVTSRDGLRMTTSALSWRNQDRRLYTDDAVEIRREGTTIVGRGLDVQMDEQRAVLGKRVRVVIENRANANITLFPRSGS
ncbi:MAG: LPS export ABC transporter periplasmic protein LptC [Candidatus Rokuibacteriota bacterium]